jgi:hypothetical protein
MEMVTSETDEITFESSSESSTMGQQVQCTTPIPPEPVVLILEGERNGAAIYIAEPHSMQHNYKILTTKIII